MKTQIGNKYEIESDSHCYTLYKIGTSGAGAKKPGEKTRRVIGYYGDIESLIKSFPNRALLCSGAETLQGAIAEVKALTKALREAING